MFLGLISVFVIVVVVTIIDIVIMSIMIIVVPRHALHLLGAVQESQTPEVREKTKLPGDNVLIIGCLLFVVVMISRLYCLLLNKKSQILCL